MNGVSQLSRPAGRAPTRQRRADIDCAKGLAIVLVVFGHLVARADPRGVIWYEPLRSAVYLFHMPFFLYLSGYVAALTGDARTPTSRWGGLVRRRAARLLLPFLLFGSAIVLGKAVLAPLLPVDHPPDGVAEGLAALVWNTGDSPAASVWYLAVLFVYSIGMPPLLWLDGGRLRPLLLVAAILFAVPAPPALYLDRLCGFLMFFVAGALAADAGDGWLSAIDRWRIPALALFAAALIAAAALASGAGEYRYWQLALGLLSMPALHSLVRARPLGTAPVLLALGRHVFAIYLLNTICIGLAKALLLQVLPWDGASFLLFAPLLMAAGILGPIAVKRALPRLSPALDRMTD